MIVNSHPYNPSQQQQRCIGLNQQLADATNNTNNQNNNQNTTTRLAAQSQQNSLYGSAFNSSSGISMSNQTSASTMNSISNANNRSHMFDLANLQQSVFDSVSYDDSSAAAMLQSGNNNPSEIMNRSSKRQPLNVGDANQQQQHQQQNDISFYSPSSSTSLLYHIYDQINLPNEQQQQQTYQRAIDNQGKKSNNTTILNPANLFGQQQQHSQLPLNMQLHQHQVSDLQRNSTACYPNASSQYHLQQQQPFSTLNPVSYMSAAEQQNNLMLDTILRQHHAATTARQQHRPLSSSGNSSMSGNSMGITYGRHPRTMTHHQHPNTKSHNNLASVLQSSNTLSHLGLGQNSPLGAGIGGSSNGKGANNGECFLANKWKRFTLRARRFTYEYQTVLKYSLFLILLAFSLVSIIKFALMSASNTPPAPISSLNPSNSMQTSQFHPISNSNSQLGSNTLIYPNQNSPLRPDTQSGNAAFQLPATGHPAESDEAQHLQQQQQQLKSRLVIGEFIITSQNYTYSEAQKRLLAERVVKLMDQVFLSSELRRFYSRMEVTGIRANRPSGIIVNCNIILSESIAYAAQQFGLALYESLANSNDRLANQANYIIDRSKIAFNIVPDRDLRSGIVPAGLISPSTSREITGETFVAPPGGQPSAPQATDETDQDNLDKLNSVVWSEWSQWSSCIDKNGFCDPARLHSRIRKCLAQHTGESVEVKKCRQRFDPQDQELELDNCSKTCQQQQDQSPIMSDAPSVIAPMTAPSVLVTNEPPTFGSSRTKAAAKDSSLNTGNGPSPPNHLIDGLYGPGANLATFSSAQANSQAAASIALPSTTERSSNSNGLHMSGNGNQQQQQAAQQQQQQQQQDNNNLAAAFAGGSSTPSSSVMVDVSTASSQMSCSNCTSDEICLLLMQQKVPFCAKVKDRSDESGCGGWCKSQNQLCQPVGSNAFKCIHDSECLAEEWRCHDSACIPLSKRCDGHYNCYDNSDERDCPMSSNLTS